MRNFILTILKPFISKEKYKVLEERLFLKTIPENIRYEYSNLHGEFIIQYYCNSLKKEYYPRYRRLGTHHWEYVYSSITACKDEIDAQYRIEKFKSDCKYAIEIIQSTEEGIIKVPNDEKPIIFR